MTSFRKIKWGVIGCGNIANKFVRDLALIEDAELIAVASRSITNANSFAKTHKVSKAYGNYDHLFSDEDIDIVYIATPHYSHAELSIKAMENGKHVLCEKPIAINKKEAVKMIQTSLRTRRFFMEALWTRFNPSIIAIKKHMENGDIGKIMNINADFSFKSDKPVQSRVLDLKLGGGAILDIGIYPSFLAYLLLGIPNDILAKSNFHELTKCDVQTSMIFHYNHAQAVLHCSFMNKSDMIAKIYGTHGQIFIHNSWHAAQGYTIVSNGEQQVVELPTIGLGFSYEIEECHRSLRENKLESDFWTHQNSLDLIDILDQIRGEVGLEYPNE